MEVHEIVPVLEGELFSGGEEAEGAEGGGAADDGLIAAELEHGDDVVGREVEGGGLGLETRNDRFGVVGDEFLGLLARAVSGGEGEYVHWTVWSHSWSCMPGNFCTGLTSRLRRACTPPTWVSLI